MNLSELLLDKIVDRCGQFGPIAATAQFLKRGEARAGDLRMIYRNLLHTLVCGLVRATLIPAFIRLWIGHRVTIVNYHNPSPEVFDRHLEAFRRHYTLISLDKLIGAIANGSFAALPSRSMVITIDDGHEGNALLADVIARQLAPVTIYVVAGLVDTQRRLWWNVVPSASELRLLERLSDAERRARLQEGHGHFDEREYASGDVLSAKSLLRLVSADVTIGSHTLFHALLPRCSPDVATRELKASKRILHSVCGRPVEHFAYPGGAWNGDTQELLVRCGYLSGRTIDPGWTTHRTNPFALPCFGISDDASVAKALVQASGVWAYAKGFVKRRED